MAIFYKRIAWMLLLLIPLAAPAAEESPVDIHRAGRGLTVVVRDAPISEVFEMLARKEGTNVLLGQGTEGNLSVNLFDVSVDRAIRSIAAAAGYAVERRGNIYFVLQKEDVGQDYASNETQVRSFKLQYTEAADVVSILEKHLSRFGEITALEDRRLLIIEDRPDFLRRLEKILEEVDREPRQILLEARILEITLDSGDTFGIDWSHIAQSKGETITFGLKGLATGALPGLFVDIVGDNFEGMIEALSQEGRVRAMASPRLLTVEDEEAEVLIGDRLGFRVTTTINQVTTESVEFIDSGVILRFTPSVDRGGRIMLEIHPEVSTGTITDGIPSVTTTEVTTRMLAEDGQQIFIGGLIRDRSSESRRGVPFLTSIPWLGTLFSRSEWSTVSTETIVVVTPHLVPSTRETLARESIEKLGEVGSLLDQDRSELSQAFDWNWGPPSADFLRAEPEPSEEEAPASAAETATESP